MSVAVQDSALAVLAEVFGRAVEWSPVALSQGEWPEEALDGAVTGFREASFRGADYLAAARGGWGGGPREAKFSLWRMTKDESDWLFLGHFDKWPDDWTKAGF